MESSNSHQPAPEVTKDGEAAREAVRAGERKGPGRKPKIHCSEELDQLRREIATEVFKQMAKDILRSLDRFPRKHK